MRLRFSAGRHSSGRRRGGAGRRSAAAGFTLIELIIAISILAIIAGLSAPAMGDFVRNARIRDATFELRAMMVRARSEAINRNTEVQLAPVGGDWRNGWTLVTAGGVQIDSGGALGNVIVSPAPPPDIRYGIDGRLRAGDQALVISVDDDTVHPRCVTLRASGRVSTRIDSDYDPTNGCS